MGWKGTFKMSNPSRRRYAKPARLKRGSYDGQKKKKKKLAAHDSCQARRSHSFFPANLLAPRFGAFSMNGFFVPGSYTSLRQTWQTVPWAAREAGESRRQQLPLDFRVRSFSIYAHRPRPMARLGH